MHQTKLNSITPIVIPYIQVQHGSLDVFQMPWHSCLSL